MKTGKKNQNNGRSRKLRPGGGKPRGGLAAAAAASPQWLERGTAILDRDRRVVFADDKLAHWMAADPGALVGQDFGEWLGRRLGPDEGWLSEAWVNPARWLGHPFCIAEPGGRHWYELELARNEAGWFVRLASVLPPRAELAEGAWDQCLGSEAEQRRMYLRLMRAEAELDNLVQRWPGVIFSQRADFSFQYISPKIVELTGLSAEAWRQQPQRFWAVVHEADAAEVRRQCQRAAQVPAGVTTTYRIRHLETGQISYVLEHRQARVSQKGLVLAYEGVWLDTTRQTLAESRLSSAAWTETLATLTMGLAHDFSNIMSGILSLSELFLSQTEANHPFNEGLNLIKQNSLQASQLVHRIINLHRCKTGERNYYDLRQVLLELVDLVQKVLPRRITVHTELGTVQHPVYLDPVELRQVVINLALNAADAMPDHGRLLFRISRHTRRPELSHWQGSFPRLPAVCLSVQDTGCGITPRHLPLLFRPFFTTKPMDKGSGLGLYNARLFVEKHQGAISVDSREDQGTTFHLWLPEADFTQEERVPAAIQEPRRRLLLVEETGPTSGRMADFLRTNGYEVVEAAGPKRASELLAVAADGYLGLLVCADPRDKPMTDWLLALPAQYPQLKFILYLLAGGADDLPAPVMPKLHLTLAKELPLDRILDRLRGLFAGNTTS